MNWIIKIKVAAILLLAFICIGAQVIAQEAESFQILSRINKGTESSPGFSLFNERGEVAGSFTIQTLDDQKYQFKINLSNGTQTTIDALSVLFYSSQANRFFAVGTPLHSHVIAEAAIKIYTSNGQLVKDLGLVAHYPFTVGLTPAGDLYVAGNPEPGSNQYFLKKINPQGNELWSVAIPAKVPMQIKFSADGNFAGLVLQDPERSTSSFLVFNNSGQKVHQNNSLSNIAAFEIISNEKVVLSDGNQWFLFPLQSSNLISWGVLKGNVLGANPITSNLSGEWFTIVTLGNPETQYGYRIQAFDSSTGTILKESLFGGEPVWRSNRFVIVEKDNSIKLTTETEVIRLKID